MADWSQPPPDFAFVLFERVQAADNIRRFYYLAYGLTTDGPAVIRTWGRKGQSQRSTWQPYPTLAEAWPEIRQHIRRRLRHGYRVVLPFEYRHWGISPDAKNGDHDAQ